MLTYARDKISTYFHFFMIVYKNIIDKGGRLITDTYWFINSRNKIIALERETKKSLLYYEVRDTK